MECVKTGSFVYVFWAVNNHLFKYAIPARHLYVMQDFHIEPALDSIEKTITSGGIKIKN